MRPSIDLLLINPGGRNEIYQILGEELTSVEPPVWVGLIATFVRKRGFSVAVLDAEAEQWTAPQVAEKVLEYNPLLTAVVVYGHQPSASTQNMTAAGEICAAVKNANGEQKVLLLGGHVASLPDRTLLEEKVDFVAGGEGLYTLVDLMTLLKGRKEKGLNKVRGLWYREGQKILSNPPAPLLENLDQEMQGIAWDLLPMRQYRAHNWHCFGTLERKPYAAIYTTLGCPYHCSFCCIQAPFKDGEKLRGYHERVNSYRFWSPERVVGEIDLLVQKYHVRNIKFADEMFVLNVTHVERICDLLIERGYDLNIWAYARVDTVKEKLLDKLKRAGFHWLALGIEAANERVRKDVQKRFKQEDIFATLKRVREAGIHVIGNYIFGLPEDNLESMQETLDLALELNCEFANFYSAMAYPGSPLYGQAEKGGLALPEKWSGYSQHSYDSFPLPTRYLSSPEVLAFRDQAFYTYFKSSKYLTLVEEKFGVKTRRHVEEMTQFKLKRKHLSQEPVQQTHFCHPECSSVILSEAKDPDPSLRSG